MEIYQIFINDEFEQCYREDGIVLEIKARDLQRALEKFVAHFDGHTVGYETEPTGSVVVYSHTAKWTFVQRFGCPHEWDVLSISDWEPEYVDEYGETCYGLTQEEYDAILEDRIAEDRLRWEVNAYLDR